MTISLADWDEDIVYEPEEEYQAMLRAIQRTQGFGLIFLECASRQAKQVIGRVQKDITQKSVDVLAFQEPLKDGNVYKQVKQKLAQNPVDVLFIQGLELSLYDYEDTKRHLGWSSEDIYSYSWKGVPPIMVNLNQQREDFRDSFNTCLIFVLPLFAIKYLIHRAPDFFDWRSGHFHFPMGTENLKSANLDFFVRAYTDEESEQEYHVTQNIKDILSIQALLDEPHQLPEDRIKLLLKQASLLMDCYEYEGAIAGYDSALKIDAQNLECFHYRGISLRHCDREEEALESLDSALRIDPKREDTWIEKGLCLRFLDRHNEAIESYDKALDINRNNAITLNYKGISLYLLGKYKEAIDSYDEALSVNGNMPFVWANKAHAFENVGSYEKAIVNFDKALELNPDNSYDWFALARILARMGNSQAAIDGYSKVIDLKPDFDTAWHNRALAQSGIGQYEQAVLGFRKAIEIDPDNPTSWMCLGGALRSLKRDEESINCYKKSLELGKNPEWWIWSGQIIPLIRLGHYQKATLSIYKTVVTFRLDYGTKEWIERRVSIFLFYSPLKFIVQLWRIFLHKIRFAEH